MSKYYSSSIAFGANQTKTEKVVVSPTKIGDVTTDAVSGALTVDEVPTLDSLNPVSSDGVARAVIQAGAELPTRGSSDTGKVLTVKNSDGDLEWDAPATVTVDQTYDETSTNAQSGVAVAEAIAAIPAPSVDEVPEVGSTDDGKVLTASYSGGQGSYSWETAQGGGGSTYTASAPIAIESDDIKLKYTNNFALNWQWQPERVTGFDTITPNMSYTGIVTKCQVSSMHPNYSPFNEYNKFVLTVHGISWSTAYIDTSDTTTKWTIVLYKQGSPETDYAIATETYEYSSVSGNRHYMFDGVTSSFTFTFTNANIHGDLSNTPLCLAIIPNPADNVTGNSYWNTPRAYLYGAGYSVFYTPTGPVSYNIAPTPGPTPLDSLAIVSLPDTLVDQTFSATSKKAQSGVAVAGALATIKQVPASTSADSTKVLTVNSSGTPVWADAADVDVGQDNVVLTGDGDSVKMEFTRVTDTSTQYVGEVTLTSNTTENLDSMNEVFLVFDLDSGYRGYESGFSPKVHISAALTGLGGYYLYGGFSDTTTNTSLGIMAFVSSGTVAAQDININGQNNQRRYYLIGAISPNGPNSYAAIAEQLKASVSITGWPGDMYGTKVVISNIPAYSSADSGRVLQVQNDGTLAWVTLS